MTDRKYENGKLLDDSERITKIGSVHRKTSLDEIPQLINVLLGEMSLIGPRPLYSKYLPLSNDFQKGSVVNSFYGYNPINILY